MFRKQPPSLPTVGTVINNRYYLVEQIGEGGAGIVYRVEDQQLDRIVAIKLLTAHGGLAADKLARFQSEARSVARLNHPNVITLFDYAETEGQPYLVMEFIPGQDLWALDNSYTPDLMPLEVSLPIIDGILAALEYSHEQQVIHRDLKPENVMITPEGQVKVMDFGLARIQGQSRLTQQGLVAGTASYLAPELALGEPGDSRVDLYAVGVIMYELFTGRRPFSGDDPLTIISQHIHAPVVPPQRYNPNIPDELQSIVLKLMAKQPQDRYAHAATVRADLAPIIARIVGGQREDTATHITRQRLISDITAEQILLDRLSRGKMIGREKEIGELKRRWDMVRLGQPGLEPLTLVSGEAGIGKTRLLRELQVYTNLRDGYVLEGTAREQDAGTPYAIIATVLRNYVRDQSPEVLQHQTPGFVAGEVVKLAPHLAEKIGSIQPNPPLEPEAERARLLEQISQFLLHMAYEQPVLLLLDDLHFADPGSLDLLETLARQAAGTSLLIVGAYRDVALDHTGPLSQKINTLNKARLTYTLPLRRLNQEMVGQMLLALLDDAVSEEFVASVYQVTEGNPLFIEEVIKSLATDGQIILKEGHWTQRDSDQLHVPRSIKSVLGGRLERVKRATRQLLQLAATIGRTFPLDILSQATPFTELTIQYAVEEALRYELISVAQILDETYQGGSDINIHYEFQHALIRETLYEELRPLRRRLFHGWVADAMQSLAAEQERDPSPILMARHLFAANREEEAVPYLWQAGEAALGVYANTDALRYFTQARQILEDLALSLDDEARRDNLAQQYDLINQQRHVLSLTGDRERELDALHNLLHTAEALRDKQRWVEAKSRLATYHWQVGQLTRAIETAQEALDAARAENDRPGEQHALEQIARVYWTRRDSDSMTYAAHALMIAQDLGDRSSEGRLTELVGHIYTDTLNDADRGSIYFKQALKICRETGNRFEEAWTLWGMGGLSLLADDYPTALEQLEQARHIAEDIGASLQAGWDLYHIGDAWYCLGNYEKALDVYQQAHEIFVASHHERGQIYATISLGLAHFALGDLNAAGTSLDQAKLDAENRSDMVLMFRSYEALSAYYRHLGGEENLVFAIRLANRLIKLAADRGFLEHEILGAYLRAAGFFAMDNVEQALSSSRQAINGLEQLPLLHSPQITAAEIYYNHALILTALNRPDEAAPFHQKAYEETMRKADFITDITLRQDFIYNVPVNQTIVASYSS